MRTIYYFILASLFLMACNNKKETDPAPGNDANANVPKGTLLLHLHNYIDENEVEGYNIVYTTSEGRKIKLTKAQIYLSGFELVKLDGSVYSIPDKYILKVQDNQVYQLGEIPVGNYKTIRFKVGLDQVTNAKVPTTSSADLLNKPDMWFGSTAQPDGYVFLHVAGTIDTTNAANAIESDMQPFEYKIGTNAQYKQVVMPDKNFSIVNSQVQYAHMYVDYVKLFEGVVLKKEEELTMNSVSDNATSLGVLLGNNMQTIFLYEE